MTTPLEAALGYAAFCGVFPCTAKKMPIKIEGLFEHGFASATTDAAVITKTWTNYKAADIGLALPRGVLVVDVDVAKGKRGRDDFIRLFGCPPEEMATAVSTTVRGGWHVYFRFAPSLQLVQTHDHVESRCPHRRIGLRHRAFPRQRSPLDSATPIDAAHGGAAMALGAAEKAA